MSQKTNLNSCVIKTDIFTTDKLNKTLSDLYRSGVGIYRMRDLYSVESGIILRHDMDEEMESALEVAKMEFDIGIKSTFYFLVSCQFYNIFSCRGRYIINSIKSMGHEVGLHFDPSIYEDIDTNFWRELHMMESLIEDKVYSFSTHTPSLHGLYPEFEGVIDAYNKDLFSPKNYFSDSRFEFRGDLKNIIREAKTGVVQLLFHPISYCLRDENKPPNIMSLYKNVIERFGVNLLSQISKIPTFSHEIEECASSIVTINVRIK